MEKKLIGTNIFDSVEKILRSIIPGIAFCILIALFFPCTFSMASKTLTDSQLIKFFVILTIGMSIYAIHTLVLIRFILELLAYKWNKSPVNVISKNQNMGDYSKAHAKLIIKRQGWKEYPVKYSYYLWGGLHYSFMMSEMLIIFGSIAWVKKTVDPIIYYIGFFGGLILFLFSIGSYFWLQMLEKGLTENLEEEDTIAKNYTIQHIPWERF